MNVSSQRSVLQVLQKVSDFSILRLSVWGVIGEFFPTFPMSGVFPTFCCRVVGSVSNFSVLGVSETPAWLPIHP